MFKKLLIVAFVIAAVAGCTKEDQQADVDTPVAAALGAEASHPCTHEGGTCTCEGHEGQPCAHHAEECVCTCASCGHEWKCEGHEGEACHHGEEGCTCKCPECGAECECTCGHHGPEEHACKGDCSPECTGEDHKGECTCSGHDGEACPGGDACTCKYHAHGENDPVSCDPACDEKTGCVVPAAGHPGCPGKGSCRSHSGS
jgi:hypothetical protein